MVDGDQRDVHHSIRRQRQMCIRDSKGIGIKKKFGDVVALENFNINVDPGEILVLVGPSGCGKSTALRLIAGFERPDSGEISLSLIHFPDPPNKPKTPTPSSCSKKKTGTPLSPSRPPMLATTACANNHLATHWSNVAPWSRLLKRTTSSGKPVHRSAPHLTLLLRLDSFEMV